MTTRERKSRPFPGAGYAALLASVLALGPGWTGVGAATPSAPGAAEMAGATYRGIEEAPVTLIEGHWEGEPMIEGGASVPRVDLAPGFRVTGDLDGDGSEEAVALLFSNFGGSGVFSYLAVVGRDAGGGVENLATSGIGDRVQLRSATIADGALTIETVEAGPDDAACCPGLLKRRVFSLVESDLVERSHEDLGRLATTTLEDVTWQLEQWTPGEPVAESLEIDLLFDGERIAGGSGCNRYQGAITSGEQPGDFRVGAPLAVTRMACPPPLEEAERRYLAALQSATRFRFAAGRLAIDWTEGEKWGSLTFAAAVETSGTEASASPSFDCAKTESSVEKLVCESPDLAGLDRRLADVWEQALERWPGEEVERQWATQRGWINGRDDCWKADDLGECVGYAYRTRIVEIRIQSGQLQAPSPVSYRCAGKEEKPLVVSFYAETDPHSAVVTFGDNQVILFGVRAGSGAKYAAPGVEFWEHHGEARVDFFGQELECTVVQSGS